MERQEVVYHVAFRHIMIARINKVELIEILRWDIQSVRGIDYVGFNAQLNLQLWK
jgi:hypothetical protein